MIRYLYPTLLAAMLLGGSPAGHAQDKAPVEVWKSPTCGCCSAWVEHMKGAGYPVEMNDVASGVLAKIKQQAGLNSDLHACHTAKTGGYVIEGHVPAEDVARLLAEKPDAIGLAVPGMPLGSPGMDQGPDKESYEVLLVKKDGSAEVFARH